MADAAPAPAPAPATGIVPMFDPESGKTVPVSASRVEQMQALGLTVDSPEEAEKRAYASRAGGGELATSVGEGLASGATLGLSDVLASAVGGDDYRHNRALRDETFAGPHKLAEGVGMVAPLLVPGVGEVAEGAEGVGRAGLLARAADALPSSLAARAASGVERGVGEGLARLGTEGASKGILRSALESAASHGAAGAVEGGLQGAAQGISEEQLAEQHGGYDQLAESAWAGAKSGAMFGLFGGAAIGGLSGAAGGASRGLLRRFGAKGDELAEAANERAVKATGARGSDLRRLGSEEKIQEVGSDIRNHTLKDGTPLLGFTDNAESLAPKLEQARAEQGADIGAFRARVAATEPAGEAVAEAPAHTNYEDSMKRVEGHLSPAEQATIHDYTTTSYEGMNAALRGPQEYLKQWGPGMAAERQIKNRRLQSILDRQVDAGHVYRGEVERVMDLPAETVKDWLATGSVSNSSFWSTTADPAAMASTTGGKLRGNIRLHIANADAVPVGNFSKVAAEKEAIIPPGRTFFVDKDEVHDGVHHIWLEQARPTEVGGLKPKTAAPAGTFPDAAGFLERVKTEVIDPLRKSDSGPTRRLAGQVEDQLSGISEAVKNGEPVGLDRMLAARKDLQGRVYGLEKQMRGPNPLPAPELDHLRRTERLLDDTIDKHMELKLPAEDFAKYKEAKRLYSSFAPADKLAEKAVGQNLGNRSLSPTDYATGVGTAASMLAHGNPLGPVVGFGSALVHKQIRERGSAFLATLATRAQRADGEIERSLDRYFDRIADRTRAPRLAVGGAVSGAKAGFDVATALHASSGEKPADAYDRIVARAQAFATGGQATEYALDEHAPRTAHAMRQVQLRAAQHLIQHAPVPPRKTENPNLGELNGGQMRPDPVQLYEFARRVEAINNPRSVLKDLQSGRLSLASVEAMRDVYPQTYQSLQLKVIEKLGAQPKAIPYEDRIRLGLMFQLPTDTSLRPENLAFAQSTYQAKNAPVQPKNLPPANLSKRIESTTERLETGDLPQ